MLFRSAPDPQNPPEEGESIEILDTEISESTSPSSLEPQLASIFQELQKLQKQVLQIRDDQNALRQSQESLAAQLESGTLSADPPSIDLTPIQNELIQLREQFHNQEPTTPADEVPTARPPDPYTDKIFILNILVLVLVAILIFLNLFRRGKSRERIRSAGPAKKDLEPILQAVNQVADQTKALQASLDQEDSASNDQQSKETRQVLESALAPVLKRLPAEDDRGTLVQKFESLQETLSAQSEKLSHFQEAFQTLEKKAAAAQDASHHLEELKQENARLTRELQEQKVEWDEKRAGAEASLEESRALFPAWIRGEGPLEDIQNLLQSQVSGEQSAQAQAFLGQCLQLEGSMASGNASRKDLAAQLSATSQAGYQCLRKDLRYDKDQIRKSMRTWITNLDQRLTAQSMNLRLSQVFPGDSFQLATMEAVDSISGNRLTVDQPLSWLIEDTAESPPRVLQRAKVITA